MNNIQVHLLQDRTSLGLLLKYFKIGDKADDEVGTLGAHRNDHYIFFLLDTGTATMMIDFQEVELSAGTLYYVLPTQVRHRIRNELAAGCVFSFNKTT